jgi:membrane protease YdiL (CAAX protease family)
MESGGNCRGRLVLLAVVFEGGLAGLAWVLGWLIGQPALEHFSWDARDAGLGFAACLPMLLLLYLIVRWPLGPLAGVKHFFDEVARPLFGPCTLLELAMISLLAGLGEEMLFRGVLQGALARWLGPLAGLLLTSLFFGLAHPITATYAVIAFLMGLYLGGLLMAAGNLLVPIEAHALYDFLALVYLLRVRTAPAG